MSTPSEIARHLHDLALGARIFSDQNGEEFDREELAKRASALIERLSEALEWYSKAHWRDLELDNGGVAREALSGEPK